MKTPTRPNNRQLFYLLLSRLMIAAVLILAHVNCAKTPSETDTTAVTPTDTASTASSAPSSGSDAASSGAETPTDTEADQLPTDAEDVGTYVGNGPGTTTVKSLISFLTVADSASTSTSTTTTTTATTTTDATTPSVSNANTSTTTVEIGSEVAAANGYCYEVSWDRIPGPETQRCLVTPNHYDLGLLKIKWLDCKNSSGESVVCDSETNDYASTTGFTLYDDGLTHMDIYDVETVFDKPLTELTEDVPTGGLALETAYIEQQFPSSGDEAKKIVTYLQGKYYRICTLQNADDTTMSSSCSGVTDRLVSGIKAGDVLFDFGKGFQFLDTTTMTESSASGTDTRPDNYDMFNLRVSYSDTTNDLSDEIVLPLDSVMTLSAGQAYKISVSFDITSTLEFYDGKASETVNSFCVTAIAKRPCLIDADPSSIGIYNPYYDSMLQPIAPKPKLKVEVITSS